jgi:histone H3/H4
MTTPGQPPSNPGGQLSANLTVAGQVPSNPGGQLPANLAIAAQRIDNALNHNPNRPMTLSNEASTELEVVHAEYLGDLGQEAVRLARQEHLSTVDKTHVIQAADRIGNDPSTVFSNVANSIGGLFAGAGLAGAYSIVFTPGKHSTAEIVVTLILSIIGFILLTAGVTAMILRRRA